MADKEGMASSLMRLWNAGSSLKKQEQPEGSTGVIPVDNIILRKMYSQYVDQMQTDGQTPLPFEQWRKTQGK